MTNEKDKAGIEDIGCLEAINGLYAYLDGELSDQESIAEIEHHMKHCQNCFSRNELESLLSQRIKTSAANKAPKNLQVRLKTLMDKL